ncbi:MAG TPA: Lrp/AsnC family transcriptional regulator [Acidimicrobiales bacterium]|nr:Lrp/AsnC family transcriptional regulator [Acidimicrobiales bacterium]
MSMARPPTPELDETDLTIVELLLENARRTYGDIGQRVGLSAPAVKRRVDRLEEVGVITGYTAVVDHDLLGQPLEAFIELRFAAGVRVDAIANVANDIAEVRTVFTTAGDPDALVWVRVRDVHHLKAVVDRLRSTGGALGTKTLMVLGTSSRPPNSLVQTLRPQGR